MKNRKIKFRVWDSKNKKFIHENDFCIYRGNPVEIRTQVGDGYCCIDLATTDCGSGEYVEFDWVVQQYTGIKDSAGNEIYEGDILKYTLGFEETYISIVSFIDNGWQLVNTDGILHCPLNYYPEREIIGNINENPELLK
jgi:uncharacterized phage protein (TIGR01671 family)